MKTKLVIAIFGIAITTHANAIQCVARQTSNYLGYRGYESSYIFHSTEQRCTAPQYWYFFTDESSSNLCPTEYTKTLTVTEYIKDSNSSIASNNSQLGNNNLEIYFFETCNTCASGYSRVQLALIEDEDKGTFYKIYGCGKCTEDPTWTKSGAIESIKICNTIDGSPTTQYRCAAGFYGTGANGSNCEICPPLLNGETSPVFGTSEPGYNTDITDCYLTPGTYKDTTGTFIISGDCDYKK